MSTVPPEDTDVQDDSNGFQDQEQQIADEEEEGGLPSPDYGDGSPPDFLWVKEDQDHVIVTIYAYKDPSSGRLRSVTTEPSYVNRDLKMIEFPIETEWTVPTRMQLDDYRSRATRYNTAARAALVSRPAVEDLLIRNHLKKVCFIVGDNQRSNMDLKMSKNGGLSTQSMKELNSLHVSVIDLLFMKYVDESALIV